MFLGKKLKPEFNGIRTRSKDSNKSPNSLSKLNEEHFKYNNKKEKDNKKILKFIIIKCKCIKQSNLEFIIIKMLHLEIIINTTINSTFQLEDQCQKTMIQALHLNILLFDHSFA
jgi:hypothetical protein